MDTAEEIRYLILAIQREGHRQFAEALRPLDLTPAQAEVLRILSEIEPISLLGLGAHLVCESGSPSRLINRMVKADLIVKQPSPEDRRAVVLSLSDKARSLLPALDAIEAGMHAQIDAVLSEIDLPTQAIIRGLWRFAEGTESGDALQRRKAKF